jgi:ATP/maltotriose-dependent transcriptional regulator MalT
MAEGGKNMVTHERPHTRSLSESFEGDRTTAQAPVLEEVLHLLDKAVVLGALTPAGGVELRFANRAAEKLLGAPRAQVAPMIEGAMRRTLEASGLSQSPAVDHWVCGGRSVRARVTRLRVGAQDLLAAEIEAEQIQPREGTAALAQHFQLNMQEARLLRLVWRGLANEEIGAALGIPAGTVKSRLYRLFRRLGVRTRAQAAVQAADLLSRMGMTAEMAQIPVGHV